MVGWLFKKKLLVIQKVSYSTRQFFILLTAPISSLNELCASSPELHMNFNIWAMDIMSSELQMSDAKLWSADACSDLQTLTSEPCKSYFELQTSPSALWTLPSEPQSFPFELLTSRCYWNQSLSFKNRPVISVRRWTTCKIYARVFT